MYNGVERLLTDVIKEFATVSNYIVRARLKLGWEIHAALTTPVKSRQKKEVTDDQPT